MNWPWAQPKEHDEPVDVVAERLARVADELESATQELRSLVGGLRGSAGAGSEGGVDDEQQQ